eukprot:scaffold20613_cov51-Phaeocystis_antarctica.AAC.1
MSHAHVSLQVWKTHALWPRGGPLSGNTSLLLSGMYAAQASNPGLASRHGPRQVSRQGPRQVCYSDSVPGRRLKPLGDVRCRLGVLNPEVDGHVV